MALSVVEPVNSAIERARRVCFRPLDMSKWFIIGFCAFLDGLAEGGSSVPSCNFNSPSGGGGRGGGGGGSPAEVFDWIGSHLWLIVVIVLVVLILGIALGALITWIGSRGQFMFIDNIVRNRGAVADPWREYRKEGNSAFWFRFLFGLVVLAAFLVVLGVGLLIALADIQARRFGPSAGIGLTVGITGVVIVAIVSEVISLFLNDFVAPIMYLRRLGVMAAWRELYTAMLAGHAGKFVLYVLFKIVLSFVVGLIAGIVTCFTCCIAAIPYVGTHVLLLPLHVFQRSYSLYFLEQFGREWQFFTREDVLTAELVDEEDEWPDQRFRPGDEHIRPPDDRYPPE